jgi:sigma-B regulation protein RsbU (phosphoserine phosphatase)
MKNEFASSNETFLQLRNTPEFLNSLINEICSCILLLNNKMELRAFNDPMKNIFINQKDEHLNVERCGEALGCAYTVEEKKRCGETSKCSSCELRKHALLAYINHEPVFNKIISREFYKTDSEKVMRHLRYSIRTFEMDNFHYIMLIINDITQLYNQEKLINYQEKIIREYDPSYSQN